MSDNIEIFKPENQTIEELFGNRDAFYQMPIYQRPYAWDKERVEQLWYDILEAYKNNKEDQTIDKNYFLGSIVVVKNGKNVDVVDGQQRLTTLTILFSTLRDLKLSKISEENKSIINNSIKDAVKTKQRLKLTTHSKNQVVFEETIINGINFDSDITTRKDNRFLQTAFYFKNLIEKSLNPKSEDFVADFDDFIDYIFTKTTIIRVTCFEENFAIKLFSVLNDRGLDLSPADIIKAHFLQNLDEFQRIGFVEVWKEIENTLKFADESLHGLLNLYLYYLKSSNPKKSLQDELKQELKGIHPQKAILSIKDFVESYILIMTDTNDKYISMLKYLPHSIYWKAILTTAIHEKYTHFDELKELITKYFYQSWIAGGTTNRIKQTAFKILKKVKNKSDISELRNLVSENIQKYKGYKNFLNANNLYWTRWLKPVLLTIEYFEHEKIEFIPITRDIQIEHILPDQWEKDNFNWKEKFTKDVAENLLHSLGNLTLLSGRKNIQASNRNYSDKQEIYKGNSGKGFDGKTYFEITKQILDDYTDWTPLNIENRYNKLVEKIDSILEI